SPASRASHSSSAAHTGPATSEACGTRASTTLTMARMTTVTTTAGPADSRGAGGMGAVPLARCRAFAVPLRLAARALRERARALFLAGRVAQRPLAARFRGYLGPAAPLAGHHLPGTRPVLLLGGLGRGEPLGAQRRRRLPSQGRYPLAHLAERPFERLRLGTGAGVLRPCLAPAAGLGYPGARGPAVLTDVLVAGPPDPRFERDRPVFVERGERGLVGLRDQELLRLGEHRQQGRVHVFSCI